MKHNHFAFLIFCIALSCQSLQAQQEFCGTRVNDQHYAMQRLENYSNVHKPDRGILYVPLKVHTVANDNASSFYMGWHLFETLCTLNEDFLPSGMQFFLEEDFNYIRNTSWNDHANYDKGEEMMIENNVPGMVNCYLVTNPAGNCGYFTYAGDGVALNKTCLGKSSHTWAHELGHYFSLPHTFFGWEGINYTNGKKTSEYQADVRRQIENIVRSQCKRQADLFCDTYPDYISNRWTCNDNGTSNIILRDLQDSTFRVDGTLFMSYSNDQCMNRFTSEQMNAMHTSLNGPRAELLRPSAIPKMIDQSEVVLQFPLDSMELSGKQVPVRWEAVPNASYYVLQISRTASFSIVVKNLLLTKPEALIDSLTAGKNFWWRVRAYSNFDFCGAESAVGVFTTKSEIVASESLDRASNVTFYPNPLTVGGKAFMNWSHGSKMPESLQLLGINGAFVRNIPFEAMQEGIMLEVPALNSGLYLIRATFPNQTIITKISIQ